MAAFLDLCRFIPTAGGISDWTYSSSVGGCQGPTAANAANGTVYKFLAISSDLTQWEVAEGAYSSATGTFSRTTVLYNSSGTGAKTPGQSGAGTKINFTAAPQVAVIGVKEDLISVEEANGFTAGQQQQARQNIMASASGGCSRLVYASATQIKLAPYGGSDIRLTGAIYQIPSGGITAANTATWVNGVSGQNLAASTTYYVYLINTGTVSSPSLALEFSTTGHTTDTTAGNVGVEIKSGDWTRSLVGMVRTNASAQFVSSSASQYVASWFNRQSRLQAGGYINGVTTTANTLTELSAGARIDGVYWSDEAVTLYLNMEAANTIAGNDTYYGMTVDGSGFYAESFMEEAVASYYWMTETSHPVMPGEGYHYMSVAGEVSGGTGTYYATLYGHSRG